MLLQLPTPPLPPLLLQLVPLELLLLLSYASAGRVVMLYTRRMCCSDADDVDVYVDADADDVEDVDDVD